jgi:microcystin-dependent protein
MRQSQMLTVLYYVVTSGLDDSQDESSRPARLGCFQQSSRNAATIRCRLRAYANTCIVKGSCRIRSDDLWGIMAQPFIGEIRCCGFNFAPVGWAMCSGQLLSISQNAALFQLIGTTYGGNGVNTFALPDLRSRVPIHQGSFAGITYVLGQAAGVESVTLTTQELPAHSHAITATSNAATLKRPVTNTFYAASSSGNNFYESGTTLTALASNTVANAGGNQPHSNIQPYLTLNWCMALEGIFPSQA